jgi:hypothetical protein
LSVRFAELRNLLRFFGSHSVHRPCHQQALHRARRSARAASLRPASR